MIFKVTDLFTQWFRTVSWVNMGTLDTSVNATWMVQRRSAPRSFARGLLSCTSRFRGFHFVYTASKIDTVIRQKKDTEKSSRIAIYTK